VECCTKLRSDPDAVGSPAWRDAWLLVSTALLRYLRMHSARTGGAAPAEDLEDLASQKSLELVGRAVSGAWDPSGYTAGQAATYLATAARNCLFDWLERERRFTRPGSDAASRPSDPAEDSPEAGMEWATTSDVEPPDRAVLRREFADALCRCVRGLDRRSRNAWVLRALFEMTSRDIARHPEVNARVGHVDVLLFRGRQAVRRCMDRRGHDLADVPAGVLVDLWHRHRRGELDAETGS